jgi:isoquinoline 1-oxidoreductase beta subunit
MNVRSISRRDFLRAGGAVSAALVLGVRFAPAAATAAAEFVPNAFVALLHDGSVRITVSRSEMGQGVRTSLPRIVADELEADLARVVLVQAVGDPVYGDQNTDGSKSVRMMFGPLRAAGAAAREMLVAAAAAAWGVPAGECRAWQHGVEHAGTGRRLDYARVVAGAAALPVPARPVLKEPRDFRYIGHVARGADIEAIVTGRAGYGYDVRLPGMVYACVARAPVFDARIRDVDESAARAVAGVSGCHRIPFSAHPREFRPEEGIAVVASDTWSALRGREALRVDWSPGDNARYDTAGYRAALRASVAQPGKTRLLRGDPATELEGEGTLVEAVYETPMLAQAPMEPPVATAWVHDGACEVWAPVQDPQDTRRLVADWLGVAPAKVTINVTLLGGGFGRKSQTDFVLEAVEVSRQAGKPVKLFWTREDDIRNSYFHAEAVQSLRARLGADGLPRAWSIRAAYPSIDWMWEKGLEHPQPWEMGMGLTNLPFDVQHLSIEACRAPVPIRIGWLRSVCNVWQAFALNGFVDEMAQAAGADPVAYRLRLLGADRVFPAPNEDQAPGGSFSGTHVDTARYRRVIEHLARAVRWGEPLPEGRFRGFASHNSFWSYVATVVEIEVRGDEPARVVRVDTAVDCGLVVNPDGVRAQVEGATIYGLGIARFGRITAREGRVEQSNFGDYRIPRITDAPPVIESHLVASEHPPSGIGEPPTPTVAPALAAALFAATRTRRRSLPLEG